MTSDQLELAIIAGMFAICAAGIGAITGWLLGVLSQRIAIRRSARLEAGRHLVIARAASQDLLHLADDLINDRFPPASDQRLRFELLKREVVDHGREFDKAAAGCSLWLKDAGLGNRSRFAAVENWHVAVRQLTSAMRGYLNECSHGGWVVSSSSSHKISSQKDFASYLAESVETISELAEGVRRAETSFDLAES